MSSTPPRRRRAGPAMKTSTPLGSRAAAFSSTSASSVGGLSAASQRQPHIFRSRSGSLSTSGSDFSLATEELEEPVVKRVRANKKSKDWANFQPIRPDGLYKKLMEQPEFSEVQAEELLLTLKTDPYAALYNLIEYFIDLCGFQHVKLKNIYSSIDVSFETIIEILEQNVTEIHKAGNYLMKSKTIWTKQVVQIAHDFVKDLVTLDYAYMLHRSNNPNSILRFVSVMCRSQYRPICHTGAIIGIKMNSSYCKLAYDLNAESANTSSTRGNGLTAINEIQKYLWGAIRSVAHVNDRYLESMRLECAKEMRVWFRLRPEYYLESDDYIDDFIKFMTDASSKVRASALETCHKMITSPNLLRGYLRPFLHHLAKQVVKRMDDVDLDVTAKAVDMCIRFCELNCEVPLDRIICLVVSNYYPLAAACGRFLIGLLRRAGQPQTHSSILDNLLRYCDVVIKSCDDKVALIVEATIDCAPELQNWRVLINSLLAEHPDKEKKEMLLEFFCQSVTQTLTGTSATPRQKPRKGVVRNGVNRAIVENFLPHFPLLVERYGKNANCALSLVNALHAMDFSHLPATEERLLEVTRVCNSLLSVFKRTDDLELALACVKTLKVLQERDTKFQERIEGFYRVLGNMTVNNFKEISGNEEEAKLKNAWLRLAAAMEVTEIHEQISWDQIFSDEYESDVECLKYQLIACKFFLVHKVKSLLQFAEMDQNNNIVLDELEQDIKEFSKYLFNLLCSDRDEANVEAVKLMCDTQEAIALILEEPIKINKKLSALEIKMTDDFVVEKFYSVLENHIISKESTLDLKTRKRYLHKASQRFLLGKPVEFLHRIIIHYGACYEDLGIVFDALLNHIKSISILTFSVTMFETLLLAFDHTKFVDDDLVNSMKKATSLKTLVKQIVKTCVKTPIEALPIVNMGVRYAAKNLHKLHFLFVLTYFVERLGVDDCTVLYENTKTRIPRQHYDNPGFANFMWALKNNIQKASKQGGRGRPKKQQNQSSFSTSLEDYSIQDDSNSE